MAKKKKGPADINPAPEASKSDAAAQKGDASSGPVEEPTSDSKSSKAQKADALVAVAAKQGAKKALKETVVQSGNFAALSVGNITEPTFLWEALASIIQAKTVRNAVLIVFSHNVRGRVGIFCNRYLSGAVVQDTQTTGMEALKTLLSLRSGIFAFRVCMADEGVELKQGLALDMSELLALRAEDRRKYPTPADALGELHGPADVVPMTTVHMSDALLEYGSELMPADESVIVGENREIQAIVSSKLAADAAPEEKPLSCFEILYGPSTEEGPLPNLRQILLPALPSGPTALSSDAAGESLASYQRLVQEELAKINQHLDAANAREGTIAETAERINNELKLFGELLQSEHRRAKKWSATELKAIPVPKVQPPAEKQARNVAGIGDQDLVSAIVPTISREKKPATRLVEKLRRRLQPAVVALKPHAKVIAGIGLLMLAIMACIVASAAYASFTRDQLVSGGIKQLHEGNTDAAIANLTQAVAASPKYGRAYFHRALAYTRAGKWQQAMDDLSTAESLGQSRALVGLARAAVRERLHQYDNAIADCNAVILDDPKNMNAYQMRILLNTRLNQFGNAVQDCTAALQFGTDDDQRARLLQERAFAEAQNRDWQASLADLTEVSHSKPSYATSLQKGDAERALQQFIPAADDYTAAIKLAPQSYDSYVARGVCFAALHKDEAGLQDFTKALAIDKDGVVALYQRGSIYLNQRKWQPAAQDLQRAVDLNPGLPDMHEKLALALKHAGPVPKAASPAKLDSGGVATNSAPLPANFDELLRTGYQYMTDGDSEDALAYFSEAIRRQPASDSARRYLAYAFAQNKQYANAAAQLQALRTVRQLDDKDVLMLGVWLEKSERWEDCMDVLAKLTQHRPDYLEAKVELAKVYYDYGFPKKATELCQDGLNRSKTQAQRQVFEQLIRTQNRDIKVIPE